MDFNTEPTPNYDGVEGEALAESFVFPKVQSYEESEEFQQREKRKREKRLKSPIAVLREKKSIRRFEQELQEYRNPLRTMAKKDLVKGFKSLQSRFLKKQSIASARARRLNYIQQAQQKRFYEKQRKQLLNNLKLQKQQRLQELSSQMPTEISPQNRQIFQELILAQDENKRMERERARIINERRIFQQRVNLMKAHENLNKINLDFLGNQSKNILILDDEANIMKEKSNSIILKTNRRTILNTQDNNILQEKPNSISILKNISLRLRWFTF